MFQVKTTGLENGNNTCMCVRAYKYHLCYLFRKICNTLDSYMGNSRKIIYCLHLYPGHSHLLLDNNIYYNNINILILIIISIIIIHINIYYL